MPIESINPATEERIRSYQSPGPAQIEAALDRARAAFLEWRSTGMDTRATKMKSVARALCAGKDDYARLMAQEMGKPFAQGQSEAEKCAWVCDYFADHAAGFLETEMVATEATRSFVTFQPLGLVLAVMPWNFPFWQVFRCAAPGLMAGNAIVLKHALNVPGCALAIEKIFNDAGFPEGLFTALLTESSRTANLIKHPSINAVTLTGSVPAGKAIAAQAGSVLKKTVLELGGSDPYVVLEDADLELTAETCVAARLINSGQSCIAAKRFIVVESVCDEFERLLVEKMRAQKVGDPLAEETRVGPLARRDLRDDLHDQVQRSLKAGARLLLGGELPSRKGFYYPPTVLSRVTWNMAAASEETFGPVAAVIRVADECEAIRAANDSAFGLGAAVFTRDRERGERIAARELEAGCCFVNDFVKSDPRLPFGGIKHSGYGRELAVFGIREFVNIKTVWVK